MAVFGGCLLLVCFVCLCSFLFLFFCCCLVVLFVVAVLVVVVVVVVVLVFDVLSILWRCSSMGGGPIGGAGSW